jgi:pimeloyl-ACP methyl ester carboxylesterase
MPRALRELFREVAKTHGIEGVDFTVPAGDFYHANGLRFHYLDWGGAGYPVVFLHGNLQSANTWDLIAIQLRDRYRCYGLDQRNHGETDRIRESQGGNNRAAMLEDVKAFVDHLGLREFFLVGMSMGGMNAMGFINRYPESVRALALVDVTPGFGAVPGIAAPAANPNARPETDRPNFRFLHEFDSLEQAVDLAMQANPGRPRVHLEYTLTNSLMQREDGKWVWKRPRLEPMTPPTPRPPPTPEQAAEQRRMLEQQWEDLRKISVPTLLCLGGDSDRTNPAAGQRFGEMVKGSKVVTIPGASHNVQGDQPRALGVHLRAFFDGVLAKQGVRD